MHHQIRLAFQSSVDKTQPVTIDYNANSWRKLFSGLRCWEVKGPLAVIDEDLGPRILEEVRHLCRESSSAVLVSPFMVGKTPEKAMPVIVVSSEDKESREAAKELIDRSLILKNLESKLWLLRFPPSGPIRHVAIEDCHVPETLPLGTNIYLDPTEPYRLIGMPIYIEHSLTSMRRATANVVYNDKGYAYITTAHAFIKTSVNFQPLEVDDEDFEMPFDSNSESGSVDNKCLSEYSQSSPEATESEDFSPASSLPSQSRSRNRSQSSTESSSSPETPTNRSQPLSDLQTPKHLEPTLVAYQSKQEYEILGQASEISFSQDFAVISVTYLDVMKYLREVENVGKDRDLTIQVPKARRTRVIAWTSHGAIPGHLAELPICLSLPSSNLFEMVYKFTYIGKSYDGIRMSDSGSLITSEDYTQLYGHIVAKSENGQVAYMMAAEQVTAEIKASGNWSYAYLDDIECELFSYPTNQTVLQVELLLTSYTVKTRRARIILG